MNGSDLAVLYLGRFNGPFVHGGLSVLSDGTLLISFFPIVSKLWDFMTLLGHLFPKHWFNFYADVL